MFTAPMGPAHGISLVAREAEAPIIAGMSGMLLVSTDMTVATTDTSWRNCPLGEEAGAAGGR